VPENLSGVGEADGAVSPGIVEAGMKLNEINELDHEGARDAFLKCCGSSRWAELMATARPYSSEEDLYNGADSAFQELERDDWLDAFAAHPKIGDIDSLRKKFGNTRDWAQSEQAGVAGTAVSVLEKLDEGNRAYEEKFGYIFIVCATGKSAEEMLSILNGRITNHPDQEIAIASEEQKKITLIRLGKL
jgi:2-oxo-4-hydroxy-4-carboxy-5-ureidoimidazoline decarboxylase